MISIYELNAQCGNCSHVSCQEFRYDTVYSCRMKDLKVISVGCIPASGRPKWCPGFSEDISPQEPFPYTSDMNLVMVGKGVTSEMELTLFNAGYFICYEGPNGDPLWNLYDPFCLDIIGVDLFVNCKKPYKNRPTVQIQEVSELIDYLQKG